MKAIPMKAQAMPKIALERVVKVVVANRQHIAILGAVVCYFGLLLGSDPVTYAGAVAGILSVKPNLKKGGEK